MKKDGKKFHPPITDADIDEALEEEEGPLVPADHLKESQQFVAGVLRGMRVRGFDADAMAEVLEEGMKATETSRYKDGDGVQHEVEVPDHKTRLKYLREFRELVFGRQAGTALLSLTIGGKSADPRDITPPPVVTVDVDTEAAKRRAREAARRSEG